MKKPTSSLNMVKSVLDFEIVLEKETNSECGSGALNMQSFVEMSLRKPGQKR